MVTGMDLRIEKVREEDVGLVLSLIKDLAAYEKMSDAVVATEKDLRHALFSDPPMVEALVAWLGSEAVGFTLFFSNYSTFLGRPGLYLEDLYIKPQWRHQGFGRRLLAALAQLAVDREYGRMEWSVLDWNELAIKSYRQVGASPLKEWTTWRIVGNSLETLAASTPSTANKLALGETNEKT